MKTFLSGSWLINGAYLCVVNILRKLTTKTCMVDRAITHRNSSGFISVTDPARHESHFSTSLLMRSYFIHVERKNTSVIPKNIR